MAKSVAHNSQSICL